MAEAQRVAAIKPEPAWADWPHAVLATANTIAFHLSKGEPAEALNLLDELLMDLNDRRSTIAELANAGD